MFALFMLVSLVASALVSIIFFIEVRFSFCSIHLPKAVDLSLLLDIKSFEGSKKNIIITIQLVSCVTRGKVAIVHT